MTADVQIVLIVDKAFAPVDRHCALNEQVFKLLRFFLVAIMVQYLGLLVLFIVGAQVQCFHVLVVGKLMIITLDIKKFLGLLSGRINFQEARPFLDHVFGGIVTDNSHDIEVRLILKVLDLVLLGNLHLRDPLVFEHLLYGIGHLLAV